MARRRRSGISLLPGIRTEAANETVLRETGVAGRISRSRTVSANQRRRRARAIVHRPRPTGSRRRTWRGKPNRTLSGIVRRHRHRRKFRARGKMSLCRSEANSNEAKTSHQL